MDQEQAYKRIAALRAERTTFAVCTVVDTGGSSPRKIGAKMLVFPDGSAEGTVGGGAIEWEVQAAAVSAIETGVTALTKHHLSHDLGMCCGGKMSVLVEPQTYRPKLLVVGLGHVGAHVADLGVTAGFEVLGIDPRPEMAPKASRFSHLTACPVEYVEDNVVDQTYVVIMTHDHKLDEDVVAAVMEQEPAFLGCIGSRRKAAKFRQRLGARGYADAKLNLLRSPVGLDIGALTPEEIAISVLAELIAVRRGSERKEESA